VENARPNLLVKRFGTDWQSFRRSVLPNSPQINYLTAIWHVQGRKVDHLADLPHRALLSSPIIPALCRVVRLGFDDVNALRHVVFTHA